MKIFIINLGVIFVAILHIWFMILEMVLWQKPLGRKIFHLSPEFAQKSANLAANQGLYNGFLTAGLIWSLFATSASESLHLKIFFLSCVIIAGIFGACTVSKRIFIVQGIPALLTLIFLLASIYG